MEFFSDILEGVVGRQMFGNEMYGSAISEAGEAVTGGCMGIIMSGLFLFVGYASLIILLTGGIAIRGTVYSLTWWAFPAILLLFASAIFSPFFGVLMGVRGGKYRVVTHLGCFGLYVGAIITFMVLTSFGFLFGLG